MLNLKYWGWSPVLNWHMFSLWGKKKNRGMKLCFFCICNSCFWYFWCLAGWAEALYTVRETCETQWYAKPAFTNKKHTRIPPSPPFFVIRNAFGWLSLRLKFHQIFFVCLSHIYFTMTVWGQLGWKLGSGEENTGFNYQLSEWMCCANSVCEVVFVLVCVQWLREGPRKAPIKEDWCK